jgi:phosphoribosylanthranilate isomerase
MVRVKICGVTNGRDARAACELGAYALGFNFHDRSPRVIAPAEAWKLRRQLPSDVQAVGVFVNWKPVAVVALAEALELSAVQLHGDESPRHATSCARRVSVIKAFRVTSELSLAELAKFRRVSGFLLDGARAGQYGGTGHTADWDFARRAAATRPIILAGGLTPENVAEAILAARPQAVDVASGVESRPGKKDHGKMREFFSEVERANRELATLTERISRHRAWAQKNRTK